MSNKHTNLVNKLKSLAINESVDTNTNSRDMTRKDGVYITLQSTNTNETTSTLTPAFIDLQVNELIEDISQYDIYVKSITISTGNIPYFNIGRNILYPSNNPDLPYLNFQLNRTNYTIGIYNDGGNYFNYVLPADNYLLSCSTPTENECAGITAYCQYVSNNDLGLGQAPNDGGLNTFNSYGFPRSYFDVHSINNFVNMINTALTRIWNQNTGGGEPNVSAIDCPYLTFDPTTQLYTFVLTADFISAGYQIYTNDFLSRALDGFNWQHTGTTNMNDNPYFGLNNTLLLPDRIQYNVVLVNPQDPATGYFIANIQSEYSTITNIVDIHSIVLLTANGSDLSNIEPQYIPFQNLSNGNLPSTQSLIAFNLDFGGLNSSANNPYIQYNALVLDNKLTCKTKTSLRNLSLSIAVQTIDQELIPISLQANGGLFSCTLVFFKK